MKIYSFIGLPGSGKGTQATLFAHKIKGDNVGVGDLVRHEFKTVDLSDPFIKNLKELYDNGNPLPDEFIIDLIRKKIKSLKNDIIFDNFPFSRKQADMFFELCRELKITQPTLFYIDIKAESALNRILKRKVCINCKKIYIGGEENVCANCGGSLISRSDDNEETVKNRLKEYRPRIEEVSKIFKERGIFIHIDGEGSIKEVEELINDSTTNGNTKQSTN